MEIPGNTVQSLREPEQIQRRNLLKDDDLFHYGMRVVNSQARRCFQEAGDRYQIDAWRQRVAEFNAGHTLTKKGLYLMPVCFGISFTTVFLNQAGALVHVYTDGSVSVSTGAVEMGQGVNQRILKAVARVFSIDPARIRIETTNTTRVANASPTAASTGADLNGKAAELACRAILDRLKRVAAEELAGKRAAGPAAGRSGKLSEEDPRAIEIRDEQVYQGGRRTALPWRKLTPMAYRKRVNLSAQALYATPGIHFDQEREKGEPFGYHAYGTAISEATVDCLRGIYSIDAVRVVHDFGRSLDPQIDRGQVEGGIVQGIGWLTMEELLYSPEGILLTAGLSSYKVPDIYSAPGEIELHFLEGPGNPLGLCSSKAIGEPPFMYGIGAYFAILAAMQAFRPDILNRFDVVAPLTPERVLCTLYGPLVR